jgi:hypothetical protein
MSISILPRGLVMAAATLLLSTAAHATSLVQMNLKDLATRSDKVFRGTVLSAKPGTVSAGGGTLPTVIYRLKVDETFKGDFAAGKAGGDNVVEVRMVGALKDGPAQAGAPRRLSVFRDVPRLAVGQDYVLFTTRPSSIGLSTTVGLGQGAFSIIDAGKDEHAVNAYNNLGLGRGMPQSVLPSRGPVSYARLARAIRAVLSE